MAGEVLRGDRIVNTPFQVLMNSEKKCEVLCGQSNKPVTLTVEQSRLVGREGPPHGGGWGPGISRCPLPTQSRPNPRRQSKP